MKNIIDILLLPLVAFPWLFLTVAFAANYWIGYGVTYILAITFAGFFAHFHFFISNLVNKLSLDEEPSVTQGMQPAQKQIIMEVIRTIQKVFSDALGRDGLIYAGNGEYRLNGISVSEIMENVEINGQDLKRFNIGDVSVFFEEKNGMLKVCNIVETKCVLPDTTAFYHFRIDERDEYYFRPKDDGAFFLLKAGESGTNLLSTGNYEEINLTEIGDNLSQKSPKEIFEWAKGQGYQVSQEETNTKISPMKQFFPLDNTNVFDCRIVTSSLEKIILERLQKSVNLDQDVKERVGSRLEKVRNMLRNKDHRFRSSTGWDVVVDKIQPFNDYSEEKLLTKLAQICEKQAMFSEIRDDALKRRYETEFRMGDGLGSVKYPSGVTLNFSRTDSGYLFYLEKNGRIFTVSKESLLSCSAHEDNLEGGLKVSIDAMNPVSFHEEREVVFVRFEKKNDLLLKKSLQRLGFEYIAGRGLQKIEHEDLEIDDKLLPFAVSNEFGYWTHDGGLQAERLNSGNLRGIFDADLDNFVKNLAKEDLKVGDIANRNIHHSKADLLKALESLHCDYKNHAILRFYLNREEDKVCMFSHGDLLFVCIESPQGDIYPINRDAFYRALLSTNFRFLSGLALLKCQQFGTKELYLKYQQNNTRSERQLILYEQNISFFSLAMKRKLFPDMGLTKVEVFKSVLSVALILLLTVAAFYLYGASLLSLFLVLWDKKTVFTIFVSSVWYNELKCRYNDNKDKVKVDENLEENVETKLYREDIIGTSTAKHHLSCTGLEPESLFDNQSRNSLRKLMVDVDKTDSASWLLDSIFSCPPRPKIVIELDDDYNTYDGEEKDPLVSGAAV